VTAVTSSEAGSVARYSGFPEAAMMSTRNPKFAVDDEVEDISTQQPGIVVFLYSCPALKDEVVAVKFGRERPLAVPTDSVRRRKTVAKRRIDR
jgi:hypothetical protein